MRQYIKLSTWASHHDVTYKTAWRWFKDGKIEGYQDKLTNAIFVLAEDLEEQHKEDKAILYARVSSRDNEKSLDGQIERMRSFAAAKGYKVVEEIIEIASGLNEDRKGLWKAINHEEGNVLIVEHKDRLSRFGVRYIEELLSSKNKKLEIINEVVKKDKDEEIMEDFVSIVTSFCSRIYGRKRKSKTEKIIKEIQE